MANPSVRRSIFPDAVHIGRPGPSHCTWRDCDRPCFVELPVCRMHAMQIAEVVSDYLGGLRHQLGTAKPDDPPIQPHAPTSCVYYLMVGPTTVKIGVTTRINQRIIDLRTSLQYVVAVERGGRELERERHKQFADERIGKREDFRLSDRLKQHIETLQPQRDEILGVTAG